MVQLGNYLRETAGAFRCLIEADLSADMDCAVNAIVEALSAGRTLLVAGNGGSASDALHISGELVGRFLKERKAYNVIALSSNVSVITAWANDYTFDEVFERQVEAHGRSGDVLLVLSTSGNSKNIVRAVRAAKRSGLKVVAFTGATGGVLNGEADVVIRAPSRSTPHIQEMHVALYHYLCQSVESALVDIDESRQPEYEETFQPTILRSAQG